MHLQLHWLFSNNNWFENDTKRVFEPTGPDKSSDLCIHESTKDIVVYKYQNFVFTVLQEVVPGFEIVNNGQKLTIVSFSTCFSWNHLLQKLGYQVPLALIEAWVIRS